LPAITVTSGDALILSLGWQQQTGGGTLQSVSDDNGGTWQSTTLQANGAAAAIQIWYCVNHPGGPTNVVATYSANVGGAAADLSEWSGIAAAVPLDASAGATGSSTTPSTGIVMTSNPVDLVIGAAAQQNKLTISSGPTNSFTALTDAVTTGSSGNVNTMSGYQIENAFGSYSTGWTMSGTNKWAGSIVAFHH